MAANPRILTANPRRPWEEVSTRASRIRRVLPFLGLIGVALVVVALPPGEPDRFGGLAVAGLGFLAIAGLIVAIPWERLPDWPRLGIVALYCADVALVRESTGAARSGFSIMLLLVVVWQAAYGSRVQMAVTVTFTTLANVAPILLAHDDRYPNTEWRRTLLFAVVASVIGMVVQELVRRTNQERWVVGRVARLGRSEQDRDTREDACSLALEITGADMAAVLERVGSEVEVTASAGRELPPARLPAEHVPPIVRRALETGEAQVITDTEDEEATRGGVSEVLGMRAWVHQPGLAPGGGQHSVDLVVGWRQPIRRVPRLAAFALPRLAGEVAAIVDRRRLVERLEVMTRQDPLTGLPNRRAWDDHLTRELIRVGRTGRPLSVAIVDLDRFKAFNDAHGHLMGDQLLKAAASAWSSALRGSDVIARWGGEEFVVLMPETGTRDAEVVLARMAEATPMDQTFSAGLVTTTAAVDADALVQAADTAVYRAKALGRDRIEVAEAPTEASLQLRSRSAID